MFAASPVQGSDAETEPDSKISGLLWGVPFPTMVLSCWAEWVLVSSLLYVLILRTCQTECRCILLTESGPRMDPLHLVPYLPRAEWSPGLEDPGWRAMLCQGLKEHQMCPRRCVASLVFRSEVLTWALKRCMELCLCQWCALLGELIFILLLPGCEEGVDGTLQSLSALCLLCQPP